MKKPFFLILLGMFSRNEKQENGFTTIEFITGTVIFSLLSLVVIESILAAQLVWDNSYTHARIQKEATRSTQTMIKYLREADPSSPIGIDISIDQQRITFAIPKEVTGGTTSDWSQVSFERNPETSELVKTTSSGSEVIGRLISACQFSQTGDRIQIALESSMNSANGRPLDMDIATGVTMRN